MKAKIPHEALKSMYDAALEVLALEPWTYMEEDEIFSVDAGLGNETFYASVIGSAGLSRSIIYYRGARGWNTYERLSVGDLPPEDAIQVLDSFAVDFESWKDIDPESRKRLKRLGLGPGGTLLPAPLVYRPGKQPSLPDASEAETITRLLRVSLPVFRRSSKEPEWLLDGPDEKIFHVRPGGDDNNPAGDWVPPPDPPETAIDAVPPDELTLARLKRESLKRCLAWEVFVGDSGAAVGERGNAYLPMIAMIVDSATGFVAGVGLSPASEMPALLPQEFLKAMQTHGARPDALHVKREDVAAWLEPVARKLDIPVIRKAALPQAEEAQRALRGFLGKKR
jgi:hypothetical protein